MNISPSSEITTVSRISRHQSTPTTSGNFQKEFTAYRIKPKIKEKMQAKRNEMLNRFQGLTEEKLDRLARNHDVESMDSDALYQLAGSLMTDGIIPSYYSQLGGLNKVAVYPISLYNSYLNGERFMNQGIIQSLNSDYYLIDPVTDEVYFNYPRYGIKRLEYDYEMMQKAFEAYNSYYTDEERSRQLQLADSKSNFLEFIKLLASYRDEMNQI